MPICFKGKVTKALGVPPRNFSIPTTTGKQSQGLRPLSHTLLSAPVLNFLAQCPFKSLMSIRDLVLREHQVINLPLSASACVRTGLPGFQFGSVGHWEFVPTPLHLFPSRPPPPCHLPPTGPVLLVRAPLPGPSLFGHGSEPKPFIGSGRHARVCQQRGGSECIACQPARGGRAHKARVRMLVCRPSPYRLEEALRVRAPGGACPGVWRGHPRGSKGGGSKIWGIGLLLSDI